MRLTILLAGLATACSSSNAEGIGGGGGASSDAGTSNSCLSSSECPTGWTCNDFGHCVAPPGPVGDGGVPTPEIEYDFGAPISSDRYVYVAMTAQDELA